jgi:hypothetical protein
VNRKKVSSSAERNADAKVLSCQAGDAAPLHELSLSERRLLHKEAELIDKREFDDPASTGANLCLRAPPAGNILENLNTGVL